MYRSYLPTVALYLFISLASQASFALPPEMEMDRLVLAAEKKLEEQEFDAARIYIQRVTELKVEPLPGFYFLAGKVSLHFGELDKAQQQLTQYVEVAGREADNYEAALQMLTQIEERKLAQEAAAGSRQEVKKIQTESGITLSNTQGQAYDQRIKKLYLAKDVTAGLVLHVNSLLKSYTYLEGKIKNQDLSNSDAYSVSVKSPSQIAVAKTERRPQQVGQEGGQAAITVTSLDTLGINPYIGFRCSKTADRCVIKHPVTDQEWMIIANDPAAAADLSQALTRLIKALQR